MKKQLVILILSLSYVTFQQAAVVPASSVATSQFAVPVAARVRAQLPQGWVQSAAVESAVSVPLVEVNQDILSEVAAQSVLRPKKMWYEPGYSFSPRTQATDYFKQSDFSEKYGSAQSGGMFHPTRVNLMSRTEALNHLGLRDGFTEKELKTAFRAMTKKHHPDLGGSTEMMKKINESYSVLRDSSSSSSYQADGQSDDNAGRSQDDRRWQQAEQETRDQQWEEQQQRNTREQESQRQKWKEQERQEQKWGESQQRAKGSASGHKTPEYSYWDYAQQTMRNAGRTMSQAQEFAKSAWGSARPRVMSVVDKEKLLAGAIVAGGISLGDYAWFKYKYPHGEKFVVPGEATPDAWGWFTLKKQPSDSEIWKYLHEKSGGKINQKTHKLSDVSRKRSFTVHSDGRGNSYVRSQDSNDFNVIVEPKANPIENPIENPA